MGRPNKKTDSTSKCDTSGCKIAAPKERNAIARGKWRSVAKNDAPGNRRKQKPALKARNTSMVSGMPLFQSLVEFPERSRGDGLCYSSRLPLTVTFRAFG